jgi:preprotein translocase subunit SecA
MKQEILSKQTEPLLYIVNKLVEGWSPTLFLDDVYKRKIDQLITTTEISEKRKQIVKRFGNVGRNDPCPCQSGKKFKYCHGK